MTCTVFRKLLIVDCNKVLIQVFAACFSYDFDPAFVIQNNHTAGCTYKDCMSFIYTKRNMIIITIIFIVRHNLLATNKALHINILQLLKLSHITHSPADIHDFLISPKDSAPCSHTDVCSVASKRRAALIRK